MVHVSLDACHYVGNFIVTLLKQNVNIRPRAAHFVLQTDESVVDDDRIDRGSGDQYDYAGSGNP